MMIYYTKSGQSLADLCNELQIENPEYLKEYHNQNCSLTERWEGDIVPGMKLYIPLAQEIREINKRIRNENQSLYDFPAKGRFPFDFKLWAGTYQIIQTTYSDDTILAKYENTIRLNFEGMQNGYYHFLFSAFDFRKNEEDSDTKMNSLARMCMAVVYPIRYSIDIEGKIIDIVLAKTTEEIVSELETIKNFFPDHYSSDYVERMKAVVGNSETISKKFKDTLLNTFMFGAFYRTALGSWTISEVYDDFWPWIFDAQPIRFEFQNILLPKDIVDDGRVRIQQKGISSDHRNLEDLFFEDFPLDSKKTTAKKPIDCEHFAEYFFNKQNLSLYKIEARFQYFEHENSQREEFFIERMTDNDYI